MKRKGFTLVEVLAAMLLVSIGHHIPEVVTGLLNRAGLNHFLIEQVASLGPDQKLALFWMDLDRFKEVNDSLGHQTGDKLLAEIASRLKACAPTEATVARFGGDEFIVLLPDTPAKGALEVAERIRGRVHGSPIQAGGREVTSSVSIGLASYPEDGATLDALAGWMKSRNTTLRDIGTGDLSVGKKLRVRGRIERNAPEMKLTHWAQVEMA